MFGLFALVIWIAGIVIAKGFWSTFIAFCIPFWAWYLVIELVVTRYAL
jgi:hypothetical protein